MVDDLIERSAIICLSDDLNKFKSLIALDGCLAKNMKVGKRERERERMIVDRGLRKHVNVLNLLKGSKNAMRTLLKCIIV